MRRDLRGPTFRGAMTGEGRARVKSLAEAAAELAAALDAVASRHGSEAVIGAGDAARSTKRRGAGSVSRTRSITAETSPVGPRPGPGAIETRLSRAWRDFLAQFTRANERYVAVISRDQEALYEFFKQALGNAATVEVTLDRRMRERRQRSAPAAAERRRRDRRTRREVAAELRASGFAFVKRAGPDL